MGLGRLFGRSVDAGPVIWQDDDPRPVNQLLAASQRWKRPNPAAVWESQPSVRKVVNFLADSISVIGWKALRRDDHGAIVPAEDTPLGKLVAHPQPSSAGLGSVSWVSLIKQFVRDYHLYGVAMLAYLNGDLVRLPPKRVTLDYDAFGRLKRLVFTSGDTELDLTGEPVAMVSQAHPETGAPSSPVQALADILQEMEDATVWRRGMWGNSIKHPMLLKRPLDAPKWSKESRERFLQSWKKWKSEDVEGTPILENGMEVQELNGVSPRDAQDVETRQLTDIEVCSFFQVPPELLGIREANFGGVTALRRTLYGTVVRPLVQELEQALNESIVSAIDGTAGVYLAPDLQSMTAGSPEEKARTYAAAVGGPYMTRAEARKQENLPFIEGSDELVTPMNVTAGGQASPQDSGEQNVDPSTAPTPPTPSDDNPNSGQDG